MFQRFQMGIFFLLVNCCAFAQKPSLYFERLTTQNGLSNNKVNCFIQDQRGFMWIGTNDGLNRYDGQYFTIFRKQNDNGLGLSGNIITDLLEDPKGILWIATADGGLTKYDYRQPPAHQFTQYKHQVSNNNSIPDNIITCLLLDLKGYLWLGTGGNYVVRFNPATEKFETPVKEGTKTIQSLCMDKNGIIWVGRAGGSILKINPDNLSYEMDRRYNDLYAKLPHATVTTIFSDNEKNIWYGSWDKVLYHYNFSSDKEEIFQQEKKPFSFDNDEILSMAEDANGIIWMGGRYKGLHIYDKKQQRFLNYQYDGSLEGTIADNCINRVYLDHHGMIWLGTNRGISIYHPAQQYFEQRFLPVIKDQNGEKKDVIVYDFYKDEQDNLWIGTSEGIYIRPDNTTDFIFKPVLYKGRRLAVTRFFKDINGSFYIGTNYSLFRYDVETGHVSLLPNTDKDPVMNGIIDSRVVSVVRDTIENHPVLLVSPYGHYLACYDLVEQHWVSRIDTVKKIVSRFNLKDNLIRRFYKSNEGNMWLATARFGLGEWIKHSSLRVNYLCNNPADASTIGNDNVYDITQDKKGNLWVSTFGGGLHYFDMNTKKFTHITATNNLLEGLQTDQQGNVWMISNGNLHKYDIKHQSYLSYMLPDLEKSGGITGYIYKDNRGKMYTGGLNYFIEFDPSMIRGGIRQPAIFLTDFKIFDTSYSDLLMEKNIKLRYKQKYFTLEFSAPVFSASRNVQYSYKLEGWDKDWVEIGNRNFVQFSNLQGGNYTFKVRATTQPGIWGQQYAAMKIEVVPPLWKRGWFLATLIFLLAALVYRFIYSLQQKLKTEKIVGAFATSLYGKNTIEDILWDIAKNCVNRLGFTDCIVYEKDEQRNVLIQRAAFGPKNPDGRIILNSIEIEIGKGIVGAVAQTGKAEIIKNTKKDRRYIVDDEVRLSEITVPIFVDGKVFGIIDSEHPKKNFYNAYDLRLLEKIAVICAERIFKYLTEEKLRGKIARDLHDNMGSALSSISVYGQIAKVYNEQQRREDLEQTLNKINETSSEMITEMNDIVWAINPRNDNMDAMLQRMESFAKPLLASKNIGFNFQYDAGILNFHLEVTKRKNFFLIFKEAINNAVKYADCTHVSVWIKHSGNHLFMGISDNGKGFCVTSTLEGIKLLLGNGNEGNGLRNMQLRAGEMKGTLNLESEPGKGTSVELDFPIP
jgi:signal transduction histidine kinase/ligand-binding sensor domain-containing protein